MRPINFTLSVLFLFLIIMLIQQSSSAQQQVDVSQFEDSYKGGFFRVNVGITPGNISYTNEFSSESVVPIYFDFGGGKRINKTFAPYFLVYGHVLIKETITLLNFSQSGMSLGSNLYLRNPNGYIAPEIGLAMLMFDMNGGNESTDNLGAKFAFKWGRDFHIGGKMFFGTNIYLSYFLTTNSDDNTRKGNGFFYGFNLSVKYGK